MNSKIPDIEKVMTYVIKIIIQFPYSILLPTIVEDIIDGNLANVDINKNSIGFIGSNPPIYTNISFGSPGIKNDKNSNILILFLSLHVLLF